MESTSGIYGQAALYQTMVEEVCIPAVDAVISLFTKAVANSTKGKNEL